MTAILLALSLSGAALNSADAGDDRTLELVGEAGRFRVEPTARKRAWNPHLQSWSARRAECPALLSREIEGFGVFKLGPSCDPAELPNAH